jgi:hypothetical protein
VAYKGPGKIVGFVAVAGLAAILATIVYFRLNPNQAIPDPQYDQVFKYCTEIYVPDEADLAKVRETDRFKAVAALQPGTYKAGGDGYLFIFGGGMKADSASDRPRSIIGCRPEQMTRALEVYGMDVGPFVSARVRGAPPPAPPPAAAVGKAR